MLNLQGASGFDERTGHQRQKRKAPTRSAIEMILLGAYRECGILPGEEMAQAISRTSVTRTDNIPSGKQVRRAREKGLIILFREAMSHVARKASRVYRDEVFRHKSGRGICSVRQASRREGRSNVSNPAPSAKRDGAGFDERTGHQRQKRKAPLWKCHRDDTFRCIPRMRYIAWRGDGTSN